MRRIIWILVLLAVAAAGVLVAVGISRLAQQPPQVQRVSGMEPESDLRMIRLVFGARDRIGFAAEDRAIPDPGAPDRLVEAVVGEVIRGSSRGICGIPARARVRGAYLTPEGTCFLDLSRDLLEEWPQGDALEWVSVGALVRSITENVPAVRRVQILIEGRIVEDPPGSIPLDLPLEPEAFGEGGGGIGR